MNHDTKKYLNKINQDSHIIIENISEIQADSELEEFANQHSIGSKGLFSKYQTPKFNDIIDEMNKDSNKNHNKNNNFNDNFQILKMKRLKNPSNQNEKANNGKDNEVTFKKIEYTVKDIKDIESKDNKENSNFNYAKPNYNQKITVNGFHDNRNHRKALSFDNNNNNFEFNYQNYPSSICYNDHLNAPLLKTEIRSIIRNDNKAKVEEQKAMLDYLKK